MTFNEAENYLLSLSNLPRQEYMKDPRKCGVYLERTKFFLKLLGSPEKKVPHYIHITGTSGKGSVATLLESIFRQAGHTTGLLTSPHASSIIERWQVNGKQMSQKEFVEIVKKFKPIMDKYLKNSPHDMVSFHEITDIIGFYYFAQKKVKWGILEVGMGGRFCSSNVIEKKDAAIITNIGWDHKNLIGPTKKNITTEKAGIITAPCQVFTMEKSKPLLEIIKKQSQKVKATFNNIEYPISNIESNLEGTKFTYKEKVYFVPTPGIHQAKNSALVIEVAKSLGIKDKAIKKGLKKVKQPLRLEIISKDPTIILDGAHNLEKMKTTVKALLDKNLKTESNCSPYEGELPRRGELRGSIHLLVGFSADKEINNLVDLLAELKPSHVTCSRNTMNIFRKVANPAKVAKLFKEKGVETSVFLDPREALAEAKTKIKKNDILLVTGSIFFSGEIRKYILSSKKNKQL